MLLSCQTKFFVFFSFELAIDIFDQLDASLDLFDAGE